MIYLLAYFPSFVTLSKRQELSWIVIRLLPMVALQLYMLFLPEAVSDGSYDDSRQAGSSAFIIAPNKEKGTVCLEDASFVTELPGGQSSYRSELAGVLGVLTCVQALVKFYKISDSSIIIVLDGESAIYQSDSDWPLSIDQNSFDYIQVIRNIIKDLPISVKFHWVEGHQKEKSLTMDWWARKNDYVNGEAKEFLQRCLRTSKPPYMQTSLFHEHWAFSMYGVKLSRINKSIQGAIWSANPQVLEGPP